MSSLHPALQKQFHSDSAFGIPFKMISSDTDWIYSSNSLRQSVTGTELGKWSVSFRKSAFMPSILISWLYAFLNSAIFLGRMATVKTEGLSEPGKFFAGTYL